MELTRTNCQAENSSESKYCASCGYQLPLLASQEEIIVATVLKEFKQKRILDLKTATATFL
jgi:hypothetical protein